MDRLNNTDTVDNMNNMDNLVNSSIIGYEDAGVSIETANDLKRRIGGAVSSKGLSHCSPLNRVGAFASLVKIPLSGYESPVFVLKSEEPGSKQLLSIENDRIEWIARDLINHLINDIIVMGAIPCAVLDTIICGKLGREVFLRLIGEMSLACADNGCILVGGETSEQPGVLPPGRYILQASVLGIADEAKIIDGSRIEAGDPIIALASNGLHTNGYSLVRKLMEAKPQILNEAICGESFLDSILKPHTSYYDAVKLLVERHYADIHGMAHITGGGIHDNLIRIMHRGDLYAAIDLPSIRVPSIFKIINGYANAGDSEMLKTFNCGVGMIAVAGRDAAENIISSLSGIGFESYQIGQIEKGAREVTFSGKLSWA